MLAAMTAVLEGGAAVAGIALRLAVLAHPRAVGIEGHCRSVADLPLRRCASSATQPNNRTMSR